jgi:hypothetical protein
VTISETKQTTNDVSIQESFPHCIAERNAAKRTHPSPGRVGDKKLSYLNPLKDEATLNSNSLFHADVRCITSGLADVRRTTSGLAYHLAAFLHQLWLIKILFKDSVPTAKETRLHDNDQVVNAV